MADDPALRHRDPIFNREAAAPLDWIRPRQLAELATTVEYRPASDDLPEQVRRRARARPGPDLPSLPMPRWP